MINLDNKYSQMQKNQYDQDASNWTVDNRDPVVGSFDSHNVWSDYDNFLFKDIDTNNKMALDFACGPGRNIVKFNNRFSKIDGVDISAINLTNAKIWCEKNNIAVPALYQNSGSDISVVSSEAYDIVFSTIAMQHICVHEIRYSLMEDMFRVLKSGGNICIQMGYGTNHRNTVDYYNNNYDALHTNGGCDTRIEDPNQVKIDLEKIGFTDFTYDIRPVGPGDAHSNWIFFRAKKP